MSQTIEGDKESEDFFYPIMLASITILKEEKAVYIVDSSAQIFVVHEVYVHRVFC